MEFRDWLQKGFLWTTHLMGWFFLNICLGSLPFLQTLIRSRESDPFQIGLLCFCFSIVSSGLYTALINSVKAEQSGYAKGTYTFLISFTFLWIVVVWTIVLILPDIIMLIGNEMSTKIGLGVYIFSIILFLGTSRKSLSEIVNHHFSKKMIAGTITESRAEGVEMKASLENEESF